MQLNFIQRLQHLCVFCLFCASIQIIRGISGLHNKIHAYSAIGEKFENPQWE